MRERFRERLDRDNRRWVLALVAAASFCDTVPVIVDALKKAQMLGAAVAILLIVSCVAPLSAVAVLMLHSRLLWWVGRRLGGRASVRDLHAAQAWSLLPLAASAPVAGAVLAAACHAAFAADEANRVALARWAEMFEPAVGALFAVAAVWSACRYVVFLSEAQRFSKVRAVANQALAGVVVVGALSFLALVNALL